MNWTSYFTSPGNIFAINWHLKFSYSSLSALSTNPLPTRLFTYLILYLPYPLHSVESILSAFPGNMSDIVWCPHLKGVWFV